MREEGRMEGRKGGGGKMDSEERMKDGGRERGVGREGGKGMGGEKTGR